MKSTLTLTRRIWNVNERRSIINRALSQTAEVLESKLHAVIDDSTPAGRYYKVGRVTARATSANKGLRRARGTTSRVYVSAVFHRASAPGQPPAKLTGELYKSIRVRRNPGKYQIVATVNAPGAAILDDPLLLDRPFFNSTIDTFYSNDFVDLVHLAVNELLAP